LNNIQPLTPPNLTSAPLSRSPSASLANNSDAAKLHRAAVEFEAIMLQEFLKQAQSKMSKGLFGGGMAEDFFQDHLTQERARSMAENGGIGLAKMLEKELQSFIPLKAESKSSDKMNLADAQKRGLENYGKNSQL
jgi:peptidoglycan hydrolase FlgJ